ncbi:beta-hexosaminidase subunit alpha isoform X1 [Prionailurus iriomotensis]
MRIPYTRDVFWTPESFTNGTCPRPEILKTGQSRSVLKEGGSESRKLHPSKTTQPEIQGTRLQPSLSVLTIGKASQSKAEIQG